MIPVKVRVQNSRYKKPKHSALTHTKVVRTPTDGVYNRLFTRLRANKQVGLVGHDRHVCTLQYVGQHRAAQTEGGA